MTEKLTSLLVYAAKCISGTLLAFLITSFFNYKDLAWCLISVLLVLSPDGKDSVSLAITRIKANVVGALSGLLCLLIAANNMWALSLAIVITLAACYSFNLEAGVRSAIAATVVIMLHPEGKHIWDTAAERVIAVMAGCLLGLIITFVFHYNKETSEKEELKTSSDN